MRGDRIENGGWDSDFWADVPGGVREHRVRFWLAGDEQKRSYRLSATPDGEVLGMEVQHLRDDGAWCGGYVAADNERVRAFGIEPSGHQIVSLDPLHLEPSLACKGCPSHGFVRDGQWIGAPD